MIYRQLFFEFCMTKAVYGKLQESVVVFINLKALQQMKKKR